VTGILAPLYGLTGSTGGPPDPPGTPMLSNMTVDGLGEYARYSIDASGDILGDISDGDGLTDFDDWIAPKSGMDQFEVRATLVSGALASVGSSPTSTWLNCAGSPVWKCKVAGPSQHNTSAVLTIEIRQTGHAVAASCTVTLTGTFGG
jgi:hypothetical protein